MAVMMAMPITPPFAARPVYRCTDGNSYYFVTKKEVVKRMEASGYTCVDTSTL